MKRPELAGLTEKILKANKDGQLHLLLIKLLTESIRLNLFITLNINYIPGNHPTPGSQYGFYYKIQPTDPG